jgi:hypothetical protein
MPDAKLRPRHTTLPVPVRRLSLGGALSAVGDAAYQYIPAIKLPVLNVRKAAPVDVAAAWDAADTEGAAAGTKFQEGLNATIKEQFAKVEMAAWRRAELVQEHQKFTTWLGEKTSADPAFFNSKTNQNLVEAKAASLLKTQDIQRAANEYKLMDQDQTQFRTLGRLGEVATLNGLPTDYTNNDFFSNYFTDTNPGLMRQLFQKRYSRGQDGELYSAGEAPFRLDAPSGFSEKDAENELTTLQNFIKTSSTETGGTKFLDQVPSSIRALYQQFGGDATGYTKADSTHKTETNAKVIGELTKQFNANPSAWRQFMTTGAQQALVNSHYKQIAAEQGGQSAAQVLGAKGGKLDLGGNVSIPLSGSHLEVRNRLLEAGRNPNASPEQQKALDEAYKKLYAHDLSAAERAASNQIASRLGLQLQTNTSDIVRLDRSVQGLKPDASEKGEKTDIFSAAANGVLNGSSDLGLSDGKKTMPFWSFNVDGNADFQAATERIAKNPDGTQKSLADLNKAGYTIYNAHSLEGIAWSGNGDATLNGVKVLPGAGVVTFLPKDPTKLSRKTQEIKDVEEEANRIRTGLAALEATANKRALTPKEQQQQQAWMLRRQSNIQFATTHGYVPAIRMRAVANQSDLPNVTGYKNSMKNLPGFNGQINPWNSRFKDLTQETTDATGVRSVSLESGKAAGLPDGWGATDFVEFDIYVGHPNIHALGSEASVIRNTKTNSLNNQAELRQVGQSVDNRAN